MLPNSIVNHHDAPVITGALREEEAPEPISPETSPQDSNDPSQPDASVDNRHADSAPLESPLGGTDESSPPSEQQDVIEDPQGHPSASPMPESSPLPTAGEQRREGSSLDYNSSHDFAVKSSSPSPDTPFAQGSGNRQKEVLDYAKR